MERTSMSNQKGFTLVEILMVILLVAILAAVAIPNFINFQSDAKNSATQADVGALRTAIADQYAQQIIHCGGNATTWPPVADINANSITNSGPCSGAEAANVPAGSTQFMANGIPANPWGTTNNVTACAGTGCNRTSAAACDGTTVFSGGWCYNASTGAIWADSVNNGKAPFEQAY